MIINFFSYNYEYVHMNLSSNLVKRMPNKNSEQNWPVVKQRFTYRNEQTGKYIETTLLEFLSRKDRNLPVY
jgi:hypothetical protein